MGSPVEHRRHERAPGCGRSALQGAQRLKSGAGDHRGVEPCGPGGGLRLRGAFTLVEALLASTILGIVAATAALPFVAGVQQANEAARLEQAAALGRAMMEEILARSFFEPNERTASLGPGYDESTREKFNNIDDFHGYAETDGDLRDFRNAVITDASLAGFRREVSVAYVRFPGLGQAADDVDAFVHIQVRVYQDNTLLVTLDRVAGRED